MNLPVDSLRGTFFEEARELLAAMAAALDDFDSPSGRTEAINAVFRAAHTLKGSAGLFGLAHLERFAHVVETVLDGLRASPELATPAMVTVLTEAHDELDRMVEAAGEGVVLEASPALQAKLEALGPAAPARPVEATSSVVAVGAPRTWRLSVAFGPDTFRDGFDPLSFIRHFERLGTVSDVRVDAAGVPAQGFDPECCSLAFQATVVSDQAPEQLLSTFDFVKDTSRVSLTPADAPPTPVTDEHPEPTLATSAPADAPVAPPSPAAHGAAVARLIKIPAARLDALVDMVSELVIASAGAETRAEHNADRATLEAFAAVRKLVSGIRDAALNLRMVEIGETFSRFRRVIRELSSQLGKEVEVELRGSETELDKAMVERLADPLLHIIRNSLDHGLETPDVRLAAGKARSGKLTLEAQHQSGQIVIDVRDDGAGLNRAKIRRKAMERGLVAPGASLTDAQVDELIFLPGFSSADAVTDVSGRGVGMDVVRRTIDQLRGTVEVISSQGEGTTIRLRLPLTLAIIDGFLLGVGDTSFVVPAKLIRECLDFRSLLESEANHRLKLRDEPVPYVRLREFFNVPGQAPARESVVIIEYGERRLGLVVDRLLGVSQTVIKSLGPLLSQLSVIGGSTILGSGEVGLILDVAQLIRFATTRDQKSGSPPAPPPLRAVA